MTQATQHYSAARLLLQKILGFFIFMPAYCAFISLWRWGLKYRIENHAELQKQGQKILAQITPLMICANHLNYCDSLLIQWLLAKPIWYQTHYKKFPWNLPAGDFFGKKWYYRAIGFVGKCLFIHRDATPTHHEHILGTCVKILKSGEPVAVFPEGRRSRTGTFDVEHLTTGVGRILSQTPECAVLCVYLRSYKQKEMGVCPPRDSDFFARMEVIYPQTTLVGKQAYHDLATQIGTILKSFEEEYFKTREEKCPSK